MGVARDFNNALRKELNIFAAWLPVTNTYAVGDYGLMSNGVFVRVGNIQSDFAVKIDTKPGAQSELDFSSKGTTLIKFLGDAKVDVLPNEPIEAKLTIEFSKEDAIFARAATLESIEMASIAKVAKDLYASEDFERRYRVVSNVYRATSATIITSKSANSKIELKGSAAALQSLSVGDAALGVEVGDTHEIGLKIIGKEGVVGLSLFRLGALARKPVTLREDDEAPIEEAAPWPAEIDDDL